MFKIEFFIVGIFLAGVSCNKPKDSISPIISSISESIYSFGRVVSKSQYEAYVPVSGVVKQVFVTEGAEVQIGTPILSVSNEIPSLNRENAQLNAKYSNINSNQGKITEANLFVDLAKSKMQNDSILLNRQQFLWNQGIGSKVELEQKEMAFKNTSLNYYSAVEKFKELSKQLNFASNQAMNNFIIASKTSKDYTLKSMMDGVVYSLNGIIGEMINPQIPVAIIGAKNHFILEMQVDEYDIVSIKKGMKVIVVLNSHRDSVYTAYVSKIYPIMNVLNKSFIVEAEFKEQPKVLYPNISFEANILVRTKEKALLIPRDYLQYDSIAIKLNGEKVIVRTGMRDYEKIEILEGLNSQDQLVKP